MAILDNLLVRVKPDVADTAIKNTVNSSDFTGSGSPVQTTVSGVPAWAISGTTSLLNTASFATQAAVTGGGLTIAARIRVRNYGSTASAPLVGMLTGTDTTVANGGVTLSRNSSNANSRYRYGTSTLIPSVNLFELDAVRTVVYKVELSATSSSDFGRVWQDTIGRVGTDPDGSSTAANAASLSLTNAFVNSAGGMEFDLLDLCVWGRELTNAECAAVADDLRGTLDGAGTAPTGTVTIGSITKTASTATVPFTYDASDQTGYIYRVNGGSSVDVASSPVLLTELTPETAYTIEVAAKNAAGAGAWSTVANFTTNALPIYSDAASPVDLTGLTPSTTYTIEVRAVNAAGVGTWSTATNFTTDAAPALPPAGTVTLGSIVTGNTTASVPYTYSASDQSGFEYRLNGGTATTASVSPLSLTGLTASTAYTIEVRAINTNGSGTWSEVGNFTTKTPISFSGTVPTLSGNNGTTISPLDLSTYFAGTSTPFTYSVLSGTLPTGLTLNTSTGVISGTPTVTSTGNVVVRATDASGATADTNSFSVAIAAPVGTGTITLTDLVSNSNVPWNSSSTDVQVMTAGLASVVQKTGLTTTVGADLVITDAAIVAGTEYVVAIKIGAAYGIAKVTAT